MTQCVGRWGGVFATFRSADHIMKRCSFAAPRHIVGNLPPYTNVSLKMILTNPEGRKESDETIIQTDEDGVMCFFGHF